MIQSKPISLFDIMKPNYVHNLYKEKQKTAVTYSEKNDVIQLKIIYMTSTAIKAFIFVTLIFAAIAAVYSIIPIVFEAIFITATLPASAFTYLFRELKNTKIMYNERISMRNYVEKESKKFTNMAVALDIEKEVSKTLADISSKMEQTNKEIFTNYQTLFQKLAPDAPKLLSSFRPILVEPSKSLA